MDLEESEEANHRGTEEKMCERLVGRRHGETGGEGMKPEASQVAGGCAQFVGAREGVTASLLEGSVQAKGQQGTLHAFIAVLDTATGGSNGSGLSGDVQNTSTSNHAVVPGEKSLGSVSES